MTRRLAFALVALVTISSVSAADFTPGAQHNFTHQDGTVPKDTYQYSLWVPKNYDAKKNYPVIFYLHGGGRGRMHPNQGKRNMVAARLVDNQRWTDGGYSGNTHGFHEYLHVAPVKPIARWKPDQFKRLLEHVQGKVSIDDNRVYVMGFSMGGQGTWHIGEGQKLGYKIAAMMPLGAWGCQEVDRGNTPETCHTRKTPVWVQHCPLDHVSRISQQVPLYQNHLDCGGYGRFTMIPGKGHISRPRGDDSKAFDMRIAWLLSQTYGTPTNHTIQVKGGVIYQVAEGERGYLGDTCKYGFFEPGTVIRLTAPETRNGKRFLRWASAHGTLADPTERRVSYTVGKHDAFVVPVYEGTAKLTVVRGTAKPANPKPGDIVTVSADPFPHPDADYAFWWKTDASIDLYHPYQKSITFCMPSEDVTISAMVEIID